MDDTSTAMPSPVRIVRRRGIWEINGQWQCSVIGTCLTLDELHALARKLNYRIEGCRDTDYSLHAHFAQAASTKTPLAKLLTKLLNRKYAATIKRYGRYSGDELGVAWAKDRRQGKIAGPYWAVLTHPALADSLASVVYGEVHMMSHLAGGSTRADLAARQRLEREIAVLKERLSRNERRHSDRMRRKERTIGALRAEVSILKGRLVQLEGVARPAPQGDAVEGVGDRTNTFQIEDLQRRLAAALLDNRHALELKERLSSRVSALEAETRALERALGQEATVVDDEPIDLDGRRILYVGGRSCHVDRLRALVTTWNGDLVHHDGGREKSLDLLARAVARADVIVFPTDCVSHGAMLKVKRLCRRTMKPYVPLRTSGVASFVAGLRDCLDDTPFARERMDYPAPDGDGQAGVARGPT